MRTELYKLYWKMRETIAPSCARSPDGGGRAGLDQALMTDRLKSWRTDIISVLQKNADDGAVVEKLIGYQASHNPSSYPAVRG